MTLNTRLKKIQRLTIVLGTLVTSFMIYWCILIGGRAYWWANIDNFRSNQFVENHALITGGQHASFVALWILVLITGSAAFFFALRTVWHVNQGRLLNARTARSIQCLGVALFMSTLADILLWYLWHPILTWNNTGADLIIDGNVISKGLSYTPLEFAMISTNHSTILLCGIGFIMAGWVLYEGAMIEQENKAFV